MQAVKTSLTRLLGAWPPRLFQRYGSLKTPIALRHQGPSRMRRHGGRHIRSTRRKSTRNSAGHATHSLCRLQVEVTRGGGFGFIGAGTPPPRLCRGLI